MKSGIAALGDELAPAAPARSTFACGSAPHRATEERRQFLQLRNLLLVALALLACGTTLFADQVPISGTTTGTFAATNNNTWRHLTFNGTNFGPVTPTASGTANLGTIGTFSLGRCSPTIACLDNYLYNDGFDLKFAFTAPPNAGFTTFEADLSGSVGYLFGFGGGSVDVWFDQQNRIVNYQNALGKGTFTVQLAGGDSEFYLGQLAYHYKYDVALGNTPISAQIIDSRFTPVPEPGALLLLATVAAGLYTARRRRAKA
jgi:hypothetical protein